jgi:endonuclease YncB( thermonuclease family)
MNPVARTRVAVAVWLITWSLAVNARPGLAQAPPVPEESDRPEVAVPTDALAPQPRTDFTGLIRYRVEQVLNGDIVTIRWRQRVIPMRLLGVEAPRPEAKRLLADLLRGHEWVFIEYDPTVQRDRSGKPMAYIYRPDGVLANLKLIERGYARVSEFPGPLSELLYEQQANAREERRGLWATNEFDKSAPFSDAYVQGLRQVALRRWERRAVADATNHAILQAYGLEPPGVPTAIQRHESRLYLATLRAQRNVTVTYSEVVVKNKGEVPLRVVFQCGGRKDEERTVPPRSNQFIRLPCADYDLLVGPPDDPTSLEKCRSFSLEGGDGLEIELGAAAGGSTKKPE